MQEDIKRLEAKVKSLEERIQKELTYLYEQQQDDARARDKALAGENKLLKEQNTILKQELDSHKKFLKVKKILRWG